MYNVVSERCNPMCKCVSAGVCKGVCVCLSVLFMCLYILCWDRSYMSHLYHPNPIYFEIKYV
jgi:hypothetical protein